MENKVSYSGVVLDEKSRSRLLAYVQSVIPQGWRIIAHHMTINLGPLEDKTDLGKSVQLTATDIGISDKAIAVQVSGYPTKNAIPHITIAVNEKEGGKPVMSNQIEKWSPLGTQLQLTGVVTEVTK